MKKQIEELIKEYKKSLKYLKSCKGIEDLKSNIVSPLSFEYSNRTVVLEKFITDLESLNVSDYVKKDDVKLWIEKHTMCTRGGHKSIRDVGGLINFIVDN